MTQISPEDTAIIVDGFQRLMLEQSNEAQARAAMETPEGYDKALWQQLADMGILGLIVDPKYGGFGADVDLLAKIMEAMGASLFCGPFLSSSVWAPSLLQSCTDEAIKQRLLPELVNGQRIVAVAATDQQGLWTADSISVEASQSTEGTYRLNGTASFVLHEVCADTLLVIANIPKQGVGVFEVDPTQNSVDSAALPANDPSLRLSKINFNDCDGKLLEGVNEQHIEAALNVARLALAAEHAGGAKRIFDISVDYLNTRYQFGRPIGSYQALKHIAADLLIEVESAKTVVHSAAEALAQKSADANTLLYLSAFTCADVFREVSAQAIQLHGGIAYTKEHCAHLFWRRARSGMQLLGSSDFYRELYLQSWEEVA